MIVWVYQLFFCHVSVYIVNTFLRLQQRYAVEIINKFELFHNCELEDAQSSYDAFEKCISSINEIVIPKKKKKKHKWISDRTDELIDKRKIAKQKADKSVTLKNPWN